MEDMDKLEPVTPGEILAEEYLAPFGLSQYALAKALRVDPMRINGIVNGTRTITADTALRLARYFGTSAQYWLNLQDHYDLALAERATDLGGIEPLQHVG